MLAESQTRKQIGHKPFFERKLTPTRHSPQAYFIIKIIHLMNFTNADRLAPIVKCAALKRHERGELFVFIRQIQKNLANSIETIPAWQAVSVGRKRRDAVRRPGLAVIQASLR